MTFFAVDKMRLRALFSLRLGPVPAKRSKREAAVGLVRSEEGRLDSNRELVAVNMSVTVRIG